MKNRVLLSFALCLAGISANAQTIFTENFESAPNSMPAGWHQQLPQFDPTNQGWQFGTTIGGTLAPYVPPHTHYAFVNDLDNNSSYSFNRDTLYTPVLDFSSYSSVFISFDYWYYGGFYFNPGDYEIASIAASGDGGHTWTTIDTMGCWETSAWRTGLYDLSAFAGNANVMLAFTYDDLANDANGFVVDNINVYAPIGYDAGGRSTDMFYLCKTNNTYPVTGLLHNFGGNTISSMHLKYTVNNGPVQSDYMSALSIAPLTDYYFTHSIPWTPSVAGDYILRIWADTLNGPHDDQLHTNDTLYAYFVVVDTLQAKEPLLEEFSQASCDPCMHATPNLDSVLFNNQSTCNALRYHVSYPGLDYMNNVTQASSVGPRVSYYGIQGVPDARIDGVTDVYPGLVSSADLQSARAQGSPFTITVSAAWDPANHQYTATAYITAHGDLPAGLTARAVLTVDTMKYHNDQSQEDPPSVFAPPIGTGSIPDFYYPYTLNFPEVVEDIMPNAAGTSLGAFTSGQTQVVNFSWTKDHPWASNGNTWLYDSTDVHITVFIQNDGDLQAGWGALPGYIYQSASDAIITTGIAENDPQEKISVYPNPSGGIFTLHNSFAGTYETAVFNSLGAEVYHSVTDENDLHIDLSGQPAGIYFVRTVANGNVYSVKIVKQ
ncbi:MAG TPA: T9SS type A sorting domain-containing protein [Bacteroidia bacterium]|nr:T9SS type A sorting domain-containing protein [Bacteroidia bacterium]